MQENGNTVGVSLPYSVARVAEHVGPRARKQQPCRTTPWLLILQRCTSGLPHPAIHLLNIQRATLFPELAQGRVLANLKQKCDGYASCGDGDGMGVGVGDADDDEAQE